MNKTQFKILLVEDNALDARLVRNILENNPEFNFSVNQVTDMSTAIQALRNNTYDLILLDLFLPDSNGLETIQAIRSTPDTPPIIVLTSSDDSDIPALAAEEGTQDFVRKDSLNKDLLTKTIIYSLERHKLQVNLRQKISESEMLNRRLETLIKTVPATIYVRKPTVTPEFVYISQDVNSILGFPANKLLSDPKIWLENFSSESLPDLEEAFANLQDGHNIDWEYAFNHPEKGKTWIQDCARMVWDKDGNPVEIVGYMADITKRKQDEDKIRHLAMYDPLTDLPNRRLFFDRLQLTIENCHRKNTIAALLYIDLDGFKNINDNYGHQTGDDTLLETVERIQSTIRKSDTLARLGGDEFAVILGEIKKQEDALSVGRKLIEKIKKPLKSTGEKIALGASIGIGFTYGQREDLDNFLKKTDQAMYAAKKAGGNQIQTS
ncbi:MAG: diguanylate cyclase domain-containing protein [Thermodesulfobacteriota bacterium]